MPFSPCAKSNHAAAPRVLLDLALPRERVDPLRVGDRPAEIVERLAHRAEVAGRKVSVVDVLVPVAGEVSPEPELLPEEPPVAHVVPELSHVPSFRLTLAVSKPRANEERSRIPTPSLTPPFKN